MSIFRWPRGQAVGFRYVYDEKQDQFIHTSGIAATRAAHTNPGAAAVKYCSPVIGIHG